MILVIDDDISIRESLRFVLSRAGHEVMLAEHPKEALDALRQATPDLVLMDMNFGNTTSGQEGLELLRKVKVLYPSLPVILITAWGTIPLAVEGMRLGAADFVTKPWNNLDLLRRIDTTLQLQAKPAEQDLTAPFKKIIGSHPALLSVLNTAQKVAPTEAPVLILGENGTGKELLAEAIHLASKRAGNPFVKVNLGGISQTLFESEMFGHKKGAFTGAIADRIGRFEMAEKGTIFLDEIGDLDHASQVKLLRVLQEHTFEPLGDSRTRRVDIRVICATNADLAQMVREKSFREDLYYRINLITVKLPALRERASDIPVLVKHFAGDDYRRFSHEAITQISALPFSGNIRELKNLVERLLITHPDDEILASAILADSSLNGTPGTTKTQMSHSHGSFGSDLFHQSPDLTERDQISAALERSAGNIARAAAMLGLSRQALYRRMDKYGLR